MSCRRASTPKHTPTDSTHTHTHARAEQLGMLKAVSFGTAEQRKEKRERKHEEGVWEGVLVNRGKTKTYLQKRGYNSLYTQILKNNKLGKENDELFFLGGGVFFCRGGEKEKVFILLLSSFSEPQQNENKLPSFLLINM